MAKDTLLTARIEPELHQAFMAAAAAMDRPASQIVRELVRDFVQRKQSQEEYDAFLARKVAAGLADIAAGRTYSSEEVEAEFAVKRAEALKRIEGASPEEIERWLAEQPIPSEKVMTAIRTAQRRHAKQAER